MELSEWFSHQLKSSAEGFAWAIQRVPEPLRYIAPPGTLGEWTAARHLFHLFYYEEYLALPGMQQWLDAPLPVLEEEGEDAAWKGNEQVEDLLPRFLDIRNRQIALLPAFRLDDWNRSCETVWGQTTLEWVVAKTYQHTAEHISDVLRIALFWDRFTS